jgi:hypothetical protein
VAGANPNNLTKYLTAEQARANRDLLKANGAKRLAAKKKLGFFASRRQ